MHYSWHAINWIYPAVCGTCGRIDPNGLCKKCEIKLKKQIFLKSDDYTKDKNMYFNQHIYISNYNGIIREKIIEYKFQQAAYLHSFFSYLLLKEKKMCVLLKKYDIILPVPIHRKRTILRGYNQSELIARDLTKCNKELELDTSSLIKKKNNLPQRTLTKQERQQNACGAYELKRKEKIEKKKILLIDDVFTTGSTVNECAKILIKQGQAQMVGVLTIAKD